MPRLSHVALAASLAVSPALLRAQTCTGGVSFADRRAAVSADASFSTGARSATGGVSVGSDGPFGSLRAGAAHFVERDDRVTVVAATAGVGAPLRPRPTVQLCPIITTTVLNGAQLATGERLSSVEFGAGVAVGAILRVASAIEMVPFVSVARAVRSTTIRVPSTIATLEESGYRTAASVGAGWVLGKALAIRPSATFLISGDRVSGSYGLQLSHGFGAIRRRARPAAMEGSLETVWVNTSARVYYCPGARRYGTTASGVFMTEREALAAGARPAYEKLCRRAR